MILKGSILAILCCFWASALDAQIFLSYGITPYRKNFLSQLNTWESTEIGRPVQIIGLHFNGPGGISTGSGHRNTYLDLQFNQYLWQKITINDSVTGAISGCSYGYAEGYEIFKNNRNIDLTIGGGLNLGRLKLTEQNSVLLDIRSNQLHLKNMLICPKGLIQFRIITKYISFMATAEFQYDISSSKWKEKLWSRHKADSYPVPGFNQTGFCFFIGLGYTFMSDSEDEIEEDEDADY